MASTNINNSFFDSSYKHAWKAIIPQGLTEAEVDLIEEYSGSTGNVLDLMCGYGRHTLSLGRRGIAVTAVDNLKEYISEIQTITLQEGLPVAAIQSDVLNANIDGAFDAAICMGNSFAFFDREDALRLLQKIARHVKPGGVFIINSWMVAEIALKHFKERDWHYAGEYKCLLEYKYFFHPSRIESEQTVIAPDGSIEILKGIDYIFTLNEMEALFREAGFTTKALYSTPRKRKFSVGDGQIYIVAGKDC